MKAASAQALLVLVLAGVASASSSRAAMGAQPLGSGKAVGAAATDPQSESSAIDSKWSKGVQESADGPRWHYSIMRTALPEDWRVLIHALEAHAESGRAAFLKEVQGKR